MIKKFIFIIAVLILTSISFSHADVISIIDIDSMSTAVDKPKSGLTMVQVQEKYGQPETQSGPVGHPPITTWVYPDFCVYFEYDRVIYSVASPKK